MGSRGFSGSTSSSYSGRPLIDVFGGTVTHNGSVVRVVMKRGKISVGCTDATPEALRKLLAEYDKRFSACEEVVLQEGY